MVRTPRRQSTPDQRDSLDVDARHLRWPIGPEQTLPVRGARFAAARQGQVRVKGSIFEPDAQADDALGHLPLKRHHLPGAAHQPQPEHARSASRRKHPKSAEHHLETTTAKGTAHGVFDRRGAIVGDLAKERECQMNLCRTHPPEPRFVFLPEQTSKPPLLDRESFARGLIELNGDEETHAGSLSSRARCEIDSRNHQCCNLF
jgi:hypothetical protein